MSGDNGHDKYTVQMVDLLGAILDTLKEVKTDLKGLRGEMVELRGEVSDLRGEVKESNRRLDVLHDDVVDLRADVHFTKEDYAARLRRLEDAVFKPAAE